MFEWITANARIGIVKFLLCFILYILISCGSRNQQERDQSEVTITHPDSSTQSDTPNSATILRKPAADSSASSTTTQLIPSDSLQIPYLKNYADSLQVHSIGVFGQVEGDGEHSYGKVVELWNIGEEVIGFFNYYEGNIEADVGLITFGKFTGDSLVVRGVMQGEPDHESFYLKGLLQKDTLIASLMLRGQAEKLQLGKNQDREIKAYKHFREWKEENKYVLLKFKRE